MECSAKEESKKKITRKRGRGREEGTTVRLISYPDLPRPSVKQSEIWVQDYCEICFQKVIPPTLSASNPNAVSSVKSCQSSNGRQSALLTEF